MRTAEATRRLSAFKSGEDSPSSAMKRRWARVAWMRSGTVPRILRKGTLIGKRRSLMGGWMTLATIFCGAQELDSAKDRACLIAAKRRDMTGNEVKARC